MDIKNTERRYGLIAILFHWLMAILLIGMFILGLYMAGLPISLQKLRLYGWHKEFGMLALMLVILRLAWRFTNLTPLLTALPNWERIIARSVQWLFYILMFGIPMTGWLITSAAGLSVSFFGLFIIPDITAPNPLLKHTYHMVHKWLAYGLIALVVLHFCAALKHHFIDRDNILRNML